MHHDTASDKKRERETDYQYIGDDPDPISELVGKAAKEAHVVKLREYSQQMLLAYGRM